MTAERSSEGPADDGPASDATEAASDATADDRPVVLAVDDQARVVEAVALWLDEYEVRTATSGEDALELADEDVDVVLLDRHMPGMDGDEVLERIRERGLDYRVAMLTAVDPELDVVEMAFDEYVTKPAGRDAVRETVERLLRVADGDDAVRDLFAVTNKQAALESEHSTAALEGDERYERLRERRAELEERIESTLGGLDHDDAAAAFRDLS
ncbi:MAG: response regulator transcription factor [Haloferacaceae archaeon]